MGRKKALEKVTKEKEQKTPIITTFHPNLPSLANIVRKHWGVMVKDEPRLKRVFPEPSVIAYRREKNIRDFLVRAKISSKRKSNRKINGYSRCGRGPFHMCTTCALIPDRGIKTHKSHKHNKVFQITSNVTCVTENVVYKITCKKPQCKDFI